MLTAPRVHRDRRYSSVAWRRARDATLRRDDYTCQACGRKGNTRTMVADHKVPPHRYPGPFADAANLWTLCRACNNSKGDATVEEWRARAVPPTARQIGRSEASYRHPYGNGSPPKPTPLILPDAPPRDDFAYHLHRWGRREWQVTYIGIMDRRWAMDGTCPPDCTAYRRDESCDGRDDHEPPPGARRSAAVASYTRWTRHARAERAAGLPGRTTLTDGGAPGESLERRTSVQGPGHRRSFGPRPAVLRGGRSGCLGPSPGPGRERWPVA